MNPLSRLEWGIEPRSPRLRRKAWLTFATPPLLCAASVIFIVTYFHHSQFWRGDPFRLAYLGDGLLIGTAVTALGIGNLWPLTRLFSSRPRLRLIENWPAHCLAGITPRQMLNGIASPALRGAWAAGAILVVCGIVGATVWHICGPQSSHVNPDDWWISILIVHSTSVSLVGGVHLDLSLQGLNKARDIRALSLVMFLMLAPPLWVLGSDFMGLRLIHWDQIPLIMILVSPLRIAIIMALWEIAQRSLANRCDQA